VPAGVSIFSCALIWDNVFLDPEHSRFSIANLCNTHNIEGRRNKKHVIETSSSLRILAYEIYTAKEIWRSNTNNADDFEGNSTGFRLVILNPQHSIDTPLNESLVVQEFKSHNRSEDDPKNYMSDD